MVIQSHICMYICRHELIQALIHTCIFMYQLQIFFCLPLLLFMTSHLLLDLQLFVVIYASVLDDDVVLTVRSTITVALWSLYSKWA